MPALRLIGYVVAGFAVVFGFLFILGAFSPDGSTGWLLTGSILTLIGLGIIWLVSRGAASASTTHQTNTTLKLDLPADVNMERFKCQDCGAQLSMDNVKMVAGAPMVDCPYCGAAYQLSENPKW
ncbi:MAG: hypothetical protein HYZ26_02785 [Chloroflexi bacterium]|nr:hypothetical protein [Chloroflexota bacterium]